MDWSTIGLMVLISFGIFFVVAVGMAVGVMFGRRPISGSCGGLGNKTDSEGRTSCSLCENPSEACRELKARQQAEAGSRDRQHATAGHH